jgi:hypothetical protein
MSTQNNKDNEDRKSVRRANFSKKRNFEHKKDEVDEHKIKNKIKYELKSRRRDMEEEELWEDWEEQLDKYR